MNNTKENRKRIGVLDVFILLAVIACAVSIVLRFISTDEMVINQNAQLDNYIISFVVYDIQENSAKNFMEPGTNFYMKKNDAFFGTLREGITITDAAKFYEMHDGKIIRVTNTGTGDLYRVDVAASLDCVGTVNSAGEFRLGGSEYIAVNDEMVIQSKYLSINIKITDITKA